ncbi:helix-turn-helix transcriptional regulator [Aquincola tertiaricarbonis]|uniref:helix-turn-helix transcriptional regulator n=1 Tax=Aquincola tertiaricarbonis TaxID=391953 RepID=UPI000614B512|nr:helix-turn-helix transcriptional regulator [Aquincola tertiaricarbonis]
MYLSRCRADVLARVMGTLAEPLQEQQVRLQLGRLMLQLLDAQFFASYVWDEAGQRFGRGVHLEMDPANLAGYERYYQFHDPITLRMRQHRRAVRATDVMAQPALRRTEFFNDFLARDGLHWGINLYAWDGADNIGDMRIWRDRRHANFSDDDRDLLDLVRPAFVAALRRSRTAPPAPTAPPVPAAEPEDGAIAARLLSTRERQVAGLAAQGLPDKVIAQRLGIAVTTVRTHLEHAFRKLEVPNRAALAHRLRA